MLMPELNFPKFNIKNRLVNNSIQVFDEVRKGYFKLTPEEWVRQHVINYLVHTQKLSYWTYAS